MASRTTRDGRPVTTGIIRYLRPHAEFLDKTTLGGANPRLTTVTAPDNLGGVTFAFEIDHDQGQLRVGYSVCTENFDKARGRAIALEMLEKSPSTCLVLAYFQTQDSLVNFTVYAIVGDKLISNGELGRTQRDYERFRNLKAAVKRIYQERYTNDEAPADRWKKALEKRTIKQEVSDMRLISRR